MSSRTIYTLPILPILFLIYSDGLYATGPFLTFSKIICYDVIILLLFIAYIHHFLLRRNFLKIGHCKSCNRFEAIKPISFFFWRRGNTKKQVTLGVKNSMDIQTIVLVIAVSISLFFTFLDIALHFEFQNNLYFTNFANSFFTVLRWTIRNWAFPYFYQNYLL